MSASMRTSERLTDVLAGVPLSLLVVFSPQLLAFYRRIVDVATGTANLGLAAPSVRRATEPFVSGRPDGLGTQCETCQSTRSPRIPSNESN